MTKAISFESTTVPTDKELTDAIAIRCSECFMALLFANAFSGRETMPWKIIKNHTLADMLTEAKLRNINLASVPVAVGDEPKQMITDSQSYQKGKL